MFCVVVLLACLALSNGHAVLPVVVPAAHSVHVVAPYHGYSHGYGHGYGYGYGVSGYGHGYGVHGIAHNLGHHVWKRSPHFVEPYTHHAAVGHVAVAPVAVSHQSRVDVHSSPAVVAPLFPVVKTVAAAPVHGVGHFGSGYLGAGYYGGGYYGLGHYAGGHGYGLPHFGHYAGGHGYGLPHLAHY